MARWLRPISWKVTATVLTIAACLASPSRCRRSLPWAFPKRRRASKCRGSASSPKWCRTGTPHAGAPRVREGVYGYKTLVEEDTGRILGAHLVGPHAEEVINLFGLAIRHNLTVENLKATMFAYPTGASDIGYML